MSELKPCPFCGSGAQVNTWTTHGIAESRCFCSNSDCPNSVRTVGLERWNTRPIEDELRKRITELAGEIAKMKKYFHKPAHGTCCTCQKCGHTYDECRCDFDEALDDLDKANARIAELEEFGNEITSSAQNLVDILPRDMSDWALASLIHSIHKWEKIAQKEREE